MIIAIILMLLCSAAVGFGVGFICGRGMRREEREWMQREASEYERALREEMNDRTP